MKILLSSQDFGFGPTTQMFSVIKHLLIKGFKGDIYIKKNKSSIIFYKNFISKNKRNNLFLVDDFSGNYDKYIGFYDPEIIFEGKKKNKKTIFICNLTFLWDFKLINKYKKGLNIKNINLSKIENHHELILLGYLLADFIYIRNTDGIDKYSLFYNLIKDKTIFIGPIIYPKIYIKNKNKNNFALVQFGGQVNPISTDKFYELYFKLTKKIIDNLNIYKKIIVNPILEEKAKKVFYNSEVITTLSQEDYQRLLSESSALFSPFGINTYFESSYYDIPTFILPEQHLGHIKSILKYFGEANKLKDYSFLIYNLQEKYNLEYNNEKDFIEFLCFKYNNLLNSDLKIDLDDFLSNGKNLIKKFNLDKNINKNLDLLLKHFII